MSYIVGANKIEYEENGKMLAEVCFPALDERTVDICHTFVDEALRGRGIAGELMTRAVDALIATDRKAVATCSYAAKWFEQHPEHGDVMSKRDN